MVEAVFGGVVLAENEGRDVKGAVRVVSITIVVVAAIDVVMTTICLDLR